jgi:AhpC/TSA family
VNPHDDGRAGVGDVAPDFRLPGVDGGQYSLSGFRGWWVILLTWGSWFACRQQLPVWERFSEAHAEAGVEILAVAMDAEGPVLARQHARAAGARFPFRQVGGFDIRKPEVAEVVERVLAGIRPSPGDAITGRPCPEGAAAFQEGVRLLRSASSRK